ncbi:hypothetical protein QMA_1742 [Clostridioides difficile DA00244]|nr:hypothetical protein QAW_1878 [Clostridioides difficile CD17]EQE63640.1 hypothetical protein QCM_1676 [Clostridioides difficile CD46]EQH41392.1 hypothetical protein QMA_1742 [Clostridioides difficile DA00244]EQJ46556.1 hypothetical protein QSG_2004 [Clostridioides difficile P25]EQJ49188.1 hypothetical protein QSE_1988 [Clostridioides difficile P24]
MQKVISFILTKWYVNAYSNNMYLWQENRFILTKWYVNTSKAVFTISLSLVLY